MRILFLLTQDLESPAGVGRYFPWAKALARRGHRVSIIALHADYAHAPRKHFTDHGVEVFYVAQMHVLKRDERKYYYSPAKLLLRTIQATWALSHYALSIPADIIQIGKPQPMNGIAGWLAKVLRRQVIFVDCDDLEAANNRFSSGWQQWIVRIFERKIPKIADGITTHSHVLLRQLAEFGIPAEKIVYLPHGYDRDRFTDPAFEKVDALRDKFRLRGKEVIVYIGSMSLGSHAVDLLLESFKIIHASRPGCVLLLVGGGEDYETLRQKADNAGLGDSVIFCGRIPTDDVPSYYRLGNVSVDPVPDNASGRASLSLKMFESWASGIPLVTVDVGDRRLILGEPQAGSIVPPGDPVALMDAILEILDHPGFGNTLAQRGLARVAEFDWDLLADKIEAEYIHVLARG